ncbi:MAG TPA: hypothetical protein VHS78_01790 [Candidatus Elarobacter sp.]|jgi:hypothetical protein|nr:hypothetical protein [Candidatus Elarobacter sp.]
MSLRVYHVQYERTYSDEDAYGNWLNIGVVRTRDRAEGAVAELSAQPGFAENPACFTISETWLDMVSWEDGFKTE